MSFVRFASNRRLSSKGLDKELLDKELKIHTIALLVAMFGPLINLLLGYPYSSPPPGMYLYWAIALLIYVAILIPFLLPFTYKSTLTLIRLVILGITIEDFFSNFWRSLIFGRPFLPFYNWYTQHFPFLGSLGEPSPFILVPQWYILAMAIYFGITLFQGRRLLKGRLKKLKSVNSTKEL